MAKKEVERLLIAGGENKDVKLKYNAIRTKEEFVSTANEEGYDFTSDELDAVLHESGDDFTTFGNPPARSIWWA
ncbi:Nif11-like leader peptide family natural product precursor [Desulfovibrio sp. JC010]|uniref:Nif11-like leader peptide family natural product precursor n=1 Tax=Desulfovibrio sp. JC010 TaxID=2593641 RepID=UPI0013D7CBB3|nr:Nif11-like leader peptide family natural product precursor [Desulfovibrio sp. JC010]NDV27650.1 Nif11 family protein [Desulfovibrio sp. JC010]